MRTAPLLADFTQLRDLHTNLRINLDGTVCHPVLKNEQNKKVLPIHKKSVRPLSFIE